jgi:hypothetical protein
MTRHRSRAALAVLGATALVGGAVLALPASAAQFGDWGSTQPLTGINDPVANDGCPIEAPDGASIYIASTRGPTGVNDIWVAPLAADGTVSGAAEMLPSPVNSAAADFCPTPLRGKGLLFVSSRGGTDAYGTAACGPAGQGDIYITRQSPATGAWSEPRNLGCAPSGPNGPGTEYGPSLVETAAGVQLYFSTGAPIGAAGTPQDIQVSTAGSDGTFGAAQPVTGLNTSFGDAMPNVRKDGLEMVFTSNRPGAGSYDIWSSTRASVFDAWSTPVNVAAVNTAASETRPSLSWDAERLYLGRAGEIQVSHRER